MDMKLKDTLDKLRQAKSAHLGWVIRAQALLNGKPADEDKEPVQHTHCLFASWYYGEGKKLAGLKSYQAIDEPHKQLHAVYADICELLTEDDKGTLLTRFTGQYDKQKQQQMHQARIQFRRLQNLSNILGNKLDMLEKDLRRLATEAPTSLRRTHVERRKQTGLEVNGEVIF
jgi:hypothetical protein